MLCVPCTKAEEYRNQFRLFKDVQPVRVEIEPEPEPVYIKPQPQMELFAWAE